jgi:hypothetical protein
MNLLIAFHTVL